MSNKTHWDTVFETKTEQEFSWFQEYPRTSVDFLELFHLPLDANIIDIGGGDSHFVDALIAKGYKNVYVLDISSRALERAKTRLGEKAALVHWIESDVVDFQPDIQFDFWHDRAAFHFLTNDEKIDTYVQIAEKSIRKDGFLVLGTFSEEGPKKCSGLEIKQYTEASLSGRFEIKFDRIKCIHEEHLTPFNTIQNFVFCSFKRKSNAL